MAERKATIAHQITLAATLRNAVSKRVVNSEERRLAKTAGIAFPFPRLIGRASASVVFGVFRESSKVGTTAPPLSAKLCF
ncbi:hypothetical protein [Nostoc sp.]|uniref:hypothetical protein n=1 Tax=Nostoc sp. TaxID=1180 RepID=UPI002FF9780A